MRRNHVKKGKKRAPDSEADQENEVGNSFDSNPGSGTALIDRPNKRSRHGLQEQVSYREANAREEISQKSMKRVRVRQLKPRDTVKENETATPRRAHCGFRGAWPLYDGGPLFEPGDFEETAIYVSGDETDLQRLAQSGDWYGCETKDSLIDRRSSVGRADVENDEYDEQPGELSDQLLRQLDMVSMQTDTALARESTLCENVDKVVAQHGAHRRGKTPDQVKSREQENARAISTVGQQDIKPTVETRGRAEGRSGGKGSVSTQRRRDSHRGGSFSVHNPHARMHTSIVQSKTRPWQGSTMREISVDRSTRVRPPHR